MLALESIPDLSTDNPEKEKRSFTRVVKGIGRRAFQFAKLARHDRRRDDPTHNIELEGYAKDGPRLSEQVHDAITRDNMIESNGSYVDSIVSSLGVESVAETMTERNGLEALSLFLSTAAEFEGIQSEDRAVAGEMAEKMTFIGASEMKEATEGMANYLKDQLRADDNLQILLQVISWQGGADQSGRSTKSAGLVTRQIFDNFTADEIDSYAGRIIFDYRDVAEDMRTRAVLIDDWSISGTQMRQIHNNLDYYKDKIDEEEVLLVAATEKQIEDGLSVHGGGSIPIKSFYKIDTPEHRIDSGDDILCEGFVTGAHSSVDYNFDRVIGKMVQAAEQQHKAGVDVPAVLLAMPPLTQVTRDHKTASHPIIEQINKINGHSYADSDGQYHLID